MIFVGNCSGLTNEKYGPIIKVSNDTISKGDILVNRINALFPDENPVEVLRRELLTLSVEDYMQTVRDIRFPKRSEMREFGKVYNGNEDVYIKIRVELLGLYGNTRTFVMSFHFAERAFKPNMFPYRKK